MKIRCDFVMPPPNAELPARRCGGHATRLIDGLKYCPPHAEMVEKAIKGQVAASEGPAVAAQMPPLSLKIEAAAAP